MDHENIVQYLGFEATGEFFFFKYDLSIMPNTFNLHMPFELIDDTVNIFLEYIPGGSIATLLAKRGAPPEPVARDFTRQILRGLEYLHSQKVLHRVGELIKAFDGSCMD